MHSQHQNLVQKFGRPLPPPPPQKKKKKKGVFIKESSLFNIINTPPFFVLFRGGGGGGVAQTFAPDFGADYAFCSLYHITHDVRKSNFHNCRVD